MNPHSEAAASHEVWTVSRLNREVGALLEGSFPPLWVEGEISNLARPASGHLYFSLKDDRCQVRCAMFRSRNSQLEFIPENGVQVLVRGKVGLYQPRGDYQLIVEQMQPAGEGRLRLAFEALKRKLHQEGLFDQALKRPLPSFPRCVGVITSPSGAAIRDVLTVLRRRFPALPVIVYPVPVQGEGAAPEIARMLRLAGERAECDVLILTRGGGSLEDLWPFNEELVARAIRACPIPVVSAVGHEIDFTIADLAADLRAATPSAAAELVSPDREALTQELAALRRRLLRAVERQLTRLRHALERLRHRLVHPGHKLRELSQRLDGLGLRLQQAMRRDLERRGARLQQLHSRLLRYSPQQRLGEYRALNRQLQRRLEQAMQQRLERSRARLRELARTLDTVSPLATLERGYAIVTDPASGRVVRSSAELQPGQAVDARLAKGLAHCRVESLEPPE